MRQDIFSVGRPAGLKEYREKPQTFEPEPAGASSSQAIEAHQAGIRTGPARDPGDMRDALRHVPTYAVCPYGGAPPE